MNPAAVVAWIRENEEEGREAVVTALALKGKPADVVRKFKLGKLPPVGE